MTVKKICGYEMNAQIANGIQAVRSADNFLKRLISEQLQPTVQMQLVARTMSCLLEITHTLLQIREIAEGAKMKEKDLYQYLVGHEVDTPRGRGLVVGKLGRELLITFDANKEPLEVVRFVLNELKPVSENNPDPSGKVTDRGGWSFSAPPNYYSGE